MLTQNISVLVSSLKSSLHSGSTGKDWSAHNFSNVWEVGGHLEAKQFPAL